VILSGLAELTEEDRTRIIRESFARVASTQAGAIVFAVLFEQLYLFRPCPDEASTALANFAKARLLPYFGADVHFRIVEAVLKGVIPEVPERKQDE